MSCGPGERCSVCAPAFIEYNNRKSKRDKELVQFIKELRNAEPEDTPVFNRLLARSEVILILSDSDLARQLRISRPTVNRWRTDKNAPAVYIREHVYSLLLSRARILVKG